MVNSPLWQPPKTLGDSPSIAHALDIYSLGLVMAEVGLGGSWGRAESWSWWVAEGARGRAGQEPFMLRVPSLLLYMMIFARMPI